MRLSGQYGGTPSEFLIAPPRAREVNGVFESEADRVESFEQDSPVQRELEIAAMGRKIKRSEQIKKDRKRKSEESMRLNRVPNNTRKRREGNQHILNNVEEDVTGPSVSTPEEVVQSITKEQGRKGRRRGKKASDVPQVQVIPVAAANVPDSSSVVGKNPSPHSLLPKD